MKKFLTGAMLSLIFPVFAYAAPEDINQKQGLINNFIQTVSVLQSIERDMTMQEIALRYEQELTFPSLEEIKRIDAAVLIRETELVDLREQFRGVLDQETDQYDETDEELVERLIREKQDEIVALNEDREKFEQRYEARKVKQQESIASLTDQLEDLREENEKQWQFIRAYGSGVFQYFVMLVALIIFFFGLQWVSKKLILRFTRDVRENRQKALIKMNRIVFNTILLIIVFGMFFSQLSTFLPFLAILGTGLAFAVRDTIASFIAWFWIGSDRGYRMGQIIEVDEVVGRVMEVKMLMTILQDITPGHATGKIITFPNKFIFESKIIHHSHNMGITIFSMNFLLSETSSDIAMAEEQLKKIILDKTAALQEQVTKHETKIKKNTVFVKSDLQTKTWSEAVEDGISLRAHFPLFFEDKESTVTEIRTEFSHWIKTQKKVKLQFVTLGRHG